MIVEEWKDIKDFEGIYQISNLGRVKSLQRFVNGRNGGKRPVQERIMKQGCNHRGYLNAALSKNYTVKYAAIQRLVALAFIPNPENKPQVNHIGGNVKNNIVSNLEWNTASENNKHAYDFLGRKASTHRLGVNGKEHVRSKKTFQFTLDGVFIREYESANQAAVTNGFRCSGITAAANGIYRQSQGSKWSFENPNEL